VTQPYGSSGEIAEVNGMPANANGASTTILVADDEAAIRDALRMILEYEGYTVALAADGEEALRRVSTASPDAVLLDIRMPKLNGIEVLKQLRNGLSDAPILMISGHGTISTAVEALTLGAQDFLEKPLERSVVLHRIALALERAWLANEVQQRRSEELGRHSLVGESAAMQKVQELIDKAAPVAAPVLITGESGTGKELVARAIHERSPRHAAPFVKVNCAAIPDELIESELFGHEKGAFTGAASKQRGRFANAHRGTILLDEIGDMSLKTQAKVLRALQEGEIEPLGAGGPVRVNVRVIAATNKDLKEAIRSGTFREDLFYRLNVLPIPLPSLAQRRDDIPLLARHLTEIICRENNLKPKQWSNEAIESLRSRDWPGNIRELRNTLERALILGTDFSGEASPTAAPLAHSSNGASELNAIASLREFKERSERQYLLAKLEQFGWNITKTAQAIGTPRSNLYKKLEQYDLARLANQRGREEA
jgi:two-component system nitrogen regulation response regulator NtrX